MSIPPINFEEKALTDAVSRARARHTQIAERESARYAAKFDAMAERMKASAAPSAAMRASMDRAAQAFASDEAGGGRTRAMIEKQFLNMAPPKAEAARTPGVPPAVADLVGQFLVSVQRVLDGKLTPEDEVIRAYAARLHDLGRQFTVLLDALVDHPEVPLTWKCLAGCILLDGVVEAT